MSTFKITIKVKHLLLIIVLISAFIFVLPYGYLRIADAISLKHPSIAVSMYKKYIAAPPFVLHKDKALYSLAVKSFDIRGGSYYEKLSTGGFSMNSTYINKEMLGTTVSLYKDILTRYKNSKYYIKAYNNLLYIYTYSANTKDGEKLIREGEASHHKAIKLMAAKYNLYYKLVKKQYAEVLSLGKKIIKDYGDERLVYRLMAEASLFKKDFDNAIGYYSKADSSMAQKYDDSVYNLFEDSYFNEQITFLKNLKKNGYDNTLVTGRVSVLGKGIPFARVYLKDIGDSGMYSGEESTSYFGITDLNGNYTIKGAPVGSYRLLLVIPGLLLNDSVLSETSGSSITLEEAGVMTYNFNFVQPLKLNTSHNLKPDNGLVKLSWEPVRGAAYYTVHAILFINPLKHDGNSSWVQISEDIAANSYSLDLAAINMKATGYSISKNGVPNPQAYLGAFYPGCSVPVYVVAYDKQGLRLTSSIPKVTLYDKLPVITLSNQEFDKGTNSGADKVVAQSVKLILDGKPEQAEKILREELKKSPDHIEIMSILSNIYKIGTRIILKSNETGKAAESGEKVTGQNFNRAIELNNRLYVLTDNVEYLRNNYFIYEYDLKDYKGLLKNYDKISEAKFTGYDYGSRGGARLKLGEFKAAEKDFDKMYQAFQYNQSTDLNPILLDLFNKNFNDALIDINQTNLRLYQMSVVQLKKDIREIQRASISKGEYDTFKEILRKLMQTNPEHNRFGDYKDLINKLKTPQLSNIAKQAMNYFSIYE